MTIAENIERIRAEIAIAAEESGRQPGDITLVAASKMNDAGRVRQAVLGGVDACGENRVQELTEKLEQHAYDGAPVHFIGHLQKNKVKNVVGRVQLIQSADSEELIRLIDRRASVLGIIQDILLEVNIGGEESKTGLSLAELLPALDCAAECEAIRVRGLMTIPPVCTESAKNRAYFAQMRKLFVDIGAKKYDNNINMEILSMGMSADYCDAIREGATMVRVGSAIFGERDYTK
ncbi:MAG: YggS family pyridoxal phosphate-dependent enzyme [Candidatus Heteroscillospira sp.]|jgi:pyridoxal phosphate enzyme (YggS family)